MIKKIIFKMLLHWYIKYNREIHKLDLQKEYLAFTLGTYNDTIELLKSMMTAQTLRYFEAKGKEERLMVKGAALMLQSLLNGHNIAQKISSMNCTLDKKVEAWKKLKVN